MIITLTQPLQAPPMVPPLGNDPVRQPHLSYTQITTYLQCPRKYYLAYRQKVPPAFRSSALLFGSVIHQALALLFTSRQEGASLEIETVQEVFCALWERQQEQEVPVQYDKDDFESLQEKGLNLLAHVYEHYEANTIVAIEQPVRWTLIPGMPPMVGTIDLIELDQDGRLLLTDFKTSSKKPSEQIQYHDLQLTLYSTALDSLGLSWSHEEILMRYAVLVKTTKPQFCSVPVVWSPDHTAWVFKLVADVWQGIEKEVFYPNPSYLCGSCPYKEPCWQMAYPHHFTMKGDDGRTTSGLQVIVPELSVLQSE